MRASARSSETPRCSTLRSGFPSELTIADSPVDRGRLKVSWGQRSRGSNAQRRARKVVGLHRRPADQLIGLDRAVERPAANPDLEVLRAGRSEQGAVARAQGDRGSGRPLVARELADVADRVVQAERI